MCLDYSRRVAEVHADSTVRAAFLFYQVLAASRSGRTSEFDRCVEKLLREYPTSTFARRGLDRSARSDLRCQALFRGEMQPGTDELWLLMPEDVPPALFGVRPGYRSRSR